MRTTIRKSCGKTFFTLCLLLISFGSFAFKTVNPEISKKVPCKDCELDCSQIIITFAPIILFLITTTIIFIKLKKEDYKIGDALKENETITITSPPVTPDATTPAGPAGVPNTETIQPKSASRLLAFISGMVSLGLASTFCSFWAYNYFQTGISADLSDITNVLLTLGLGVVPYAFNKISKAIE
jgi:hypothetical protein